MSKATDDDWEELKWWRKDEDWKNHECDERCGDGVFKNPIVPPSTGCKCTHNEAAHWKGKKCRAYACPCGKFVPDEE